jgi:flagellar protein FlbD
MIELTKIDGKKITINAEEIETVETHHDTTISLKSGRKVIVQDLVGDITQKVIEYKKSCFSDLISLK